MKLVRSGEQKDRSAGPRRGLKEVECFNCHKKGHYSSNCPHQAMFCTEVVKPGHAVDNILLDTGCSRTLVHRKLVPDCKMREAGAVAIRCAHGDTVLDPLARILLEVKRRALDVEAVISDTLPMSVLLGTDIPYLYELLEGDRSKTTEDVFTVTTRAAEKEWRAAAENYHRKEEACRVRPNVIMMIQLMYQHR